MGVIPFFSKGGFMSAWTDFRDKVEGKITGSSSSNSTANTSGTVQNGIFEAIYQYGRGQTQSAVEKLTSAFRASSTGQKIEAEATKQKIAEMLPMIILGAIVLIAGGYFFARRR